MRQLRCLDELAARKWYVNRTTTPVPQNVRGPLCLPGGRGDRLLVVSGGKREANQTNKDKNPNNETYKDTKAACKLGNKPKLPFCPTSVG